MPQPPPRPSLTLLLGGAGWFWALALLATKEYDPLTYGALEPAPPLWGFLAWSVWGLLLGMCAAVSLAAGCRQLTAVQPERGQRASHWLLATYLVPLCDAARLTGGGLPGGYLLPIGFALLTGYVVSEIACGLGPTVEWKPKLDRLPWLALTWGSAIAMGGWWFWQGVRAYDDFLLGYSDFGHFATRVVNTWEGRGWLQQAPDLPIFWDHFNPGLVLLAPLWGLWPSAKLFVLVQALCLALSAPLVHAIARRLDAAPAAAWGWAAAYLALPAVGQLNLNYGYGWHPESLALPLMLGAMYALLREQRVLAAVLAVAACSFAEVVIVAVGCLAFASLVAAWRHQRAGTSDPWTDSLPLAGWFAAWLAFTAAFAAVHAFTDFSKFQEGRFADLGESGGQILLSPVLRPQAFWSHVLRPRGLYFLLALFGPLGIRNLVRSWPIVLALVPPVLVLLAWKERSGTSLAFQYTTTLIPLALLAALVGARFRSLSAGDTTGFSLAAAALATSFTLSIFLGAAPWSSPTLTLVAVESYPAQDRTHIADQRATESPGNQALRGLLAKIGTPDAQVLATGRVAAHLLRARRVETVDNLFVRWEGISRDEADGKSAVLAFDWILLDTLERAHQKADKLDRLLAAAQKAGFREVYNEHGLVLLQKP